MPIGVVATKKQEGLWSRAKSVVDKMRAKGRKVDDYWAMVMHIYQRLQGVKKSRSTHPIKLTLDVGAGVKKLRAKEEPDHPYHGFLDVQGIPVHVENKRGSVRRGPGWKTKMGHHYGEIRGSKGADGDAVDAYIGRNHDSPLVVVVHQKAPGSTEYDEDKVMLGFDRIVDALKAYRDQYDKPGFYGTHTAMSVPEFKRMLEKHGSKGRKLTKAQRKLLELVKAQSLSRGLVIELDLVKGGYDIGYISTRKDGSQWRKVAQGKWEQVRLMGGAKAVPAKAEHYHSVSESLTGKAFRSPAVGRKALYSGGAAAAKALGEGKDDKAAAEAFVEAFKNVGGPEGLIEPSTVAQAVKKLHNYAIHRASAPAPAAEAKPAAEPKPEKKPEAEAKPEPEKKPEPKPSEASPKERAEHREQQRQSLEDAGLEPHQIEAVQDKVEAPAPEKAPEPSPGEPEEKKAPEVAEEPEGVTEAKEETPQELFEGPTEEPPVPGGPPPKKEIKDWPVREGRLKPRDEMTDQEREAAKKLPAEKPRGETPAEEKPSAEKPWDEMTDKEKKKAHEKLKAEHADLLLLKAAVEEMKGMALDPRTRAYHRVLKHMKKAVKQSGGGKEPTGASEAGREAKKAAGQATGQAKRFFDRLADRLARLVQKPRKAEKEKKVTKSQQELLDLVKAELPTGHVSTYADGSQWKKVGPKKWESVGEKKGAHESPLMRVGHTIKLFDIVARVGKVEHGGEEPMIRMDSEGHGEGQATPLSELEAYLKQHGAEHVGVKEKKEEPKKEPEPEKKEPKRAEGVHGTVDDLKSWLDRAHKERSYGLKLEQLDDDGQELAKHLAIYTNGDLDVFMDPSKFAPGRAWDSEKKDFVQQADTAHVRAWLGDGEKAQLSADFDATRQDYEKARKTIAELAGRRPPSDDMPPIIYRGLALPDDVAGALEEGAHFDLGPVASFSGKEAITGKFTKGHRGGGDRPEGHQGVIFVLHEPQVGTYIGGMSHFSDEDEALSTGRLTVTKTEMKDHPFGGKLKYVYVTQEKLEKADKGKLDEAHQKIIRKAFMQRLTDRKEKTR